MPSPARATTSTIIPCLRYRDAAAAIEWLCNAFGFQKKVVYPKDDGSIAHAELTFGNGMIMLGSDSESEWGRFIMQPNQIGGYETQSAFLIVDNADEVYDRAVAAGAEIIIQMKHEDYGSGFTCRDLEGHIWSIGTYDPWNV